MQKGKGLFKKVVVLGTVLLMSGCSSSSLSNLSTATQTSAISQSNTALYEEPQAGVAAIVRLISRAKKTVYINGYLINDGYITSALSAAVKRGVTVRAIISRSVYGEPSGSPLIEAQNLRTLGVKVHFGPSRFYYDHAKYLCVDNKTCEIGSPNYTYSGFFMNREYFVITSTSSVVHAATSVFNADWKNQPAGSKVRGSLVLAPGAATPLIGVISQPGPVYIESEEIPSDFSILRAMESKGSQLHLLLPSLPFNSYSQKHLDELVAHGVQIRIFQNEYLHAKAIAGDSRGFVGSENFSYGSLADNREVGVKIKGSIERQLLSSLKVDWGEGHPSPAG